jgi:hypothetical protein
LIERGVQVDEPGQEDWGWYLGAVYDGHTYLIGIGASQDEEEPNPKPPGANPNFGEWRIMVEEPQSLWAKLTNKKTPAP